VSKSARHVSETVEIVGYYEQSLELKKAFKYPFRVTTEPQR
jgi:hypothetical protein